MPTLAEIKANRLLLGDPVEVIFDDAENFLGQPLHRLIYTDGSYEYALSETVFRCTYNAPDGCDNLVNPHGDCICPAHKAAADASTHDSTTNVFSSQAGVQTYLYY